MRMSKTATSLETLLSVRKTFISVNESWFQTYSVNALGSVKNCFIGQVLDCGHIELVWVTTEFDEDCVEIEYGTLVLGSMCK